MAAVVVCLTVVAVIGVVVFRDPYRPGASLQVTVQIVEPCGLVHDVYGGGRVWRTSDRRPSTWPTHGGIDGTMRIIATEEAVFEADQGGVVAYHRLPGGSFAGGELACAIS